MQTHDFILPVLPHQINTAEKLLIETHLLHSGFKCVVHIDDTTVTARIDTDEQPENLITAGFELGLIFMLHFPIESIAWKTFTTRVFIREKRRQQVEATNKYLKSANFNVRMN